MALIDLSKKAQKLLLVAHHEADRIGSTCVSSEHILLGVLAFGGYLQSLVSPRLSLDAVRSYVSKTGRNIEQPDHGYGQSTRDILVKAARLSKQLGHKQVGAAHIILALLAQRTGGGIRALKHFRVKRAAAKRRLLQRIQTRKHPW
jgi:ATP-dependent Clp protease ATP-binding subunit ClpC